MKILPKYLPIASASELGAIKIGTGLSIDGSGVVSAAGGESTWISITGTTRTSDTVITKSNISLELSEGSFVRYYYGASEPTSNSTWKYGIVHTIALNTATIFGEAIPTGTGTFFVQVDPGNKMITYVDTPVSGNWAATTQTTLLETYGGYHARTTPMSGRLIGAMNVYSLSNDSGASQPTINITGSGGNLLSTPISVSTASSSPVVNNTGVVTAGISVNFNSRLDIAVITTGTNADSLDLQCRFCVVSLS